jgi:4-diphosphocytidyl-2-C-methyl-D-erythritol kinase
MELASDTASELMVRSPAKVNWTLRVLGRRADGYHEIESLVSTVTLYDELRFAPRPDGRFELACDAADLPTGGENLIVRAADLLGRRAGCPSGAFCRLSKRIPLGGGLGGGSSNAAATLLALNRLWSIGWPRERLGQLGAELGSDVPLFLHGGTVLMRGRGERVEPVRLGWRGWIVLVCPRISVSTAAVYRAWRAGAVGPEGEPIPADDGGANAVEWMRRTFNMLETPAMEVCPLLRTLHERLGELSGRPVRVSGSGSTLFTAFDARLEAEGFARQSASELGLVTHVVRLAEECEPKVPSHDGVTEN